jgi:ubiquitin related modifier 1
MSTIITAATAVALLSLDLLTPCRGGLEMLFSDERKHHISIPAHDSKGDAVTVGWLVHHLCDVLMKDTRQDMFVLDGHV